MCERTNWKASTRVTPVTFFRNCEGSKGNATFCFGEIVFKFSACWREFVIIIFIAVLRYVQ